MCGLGEHWIGIIEASS